MDQRRTDLTLPCIVSANAIVLILLLQLGCTTQESLRWHLQPLESGTQELLIASHTVDETTLISGSNSTVTQLSGADAQSIPCPFDSLQLRDIHAFSPDHFLALSIGVGSASKVLCYQEGQWEIAYTLADSLGFLDCMDFWDDLRGVIYGDSFDGVPYLLTTADGGRSWSRTEAQHLPAAGLGEGGFASSGTCVQTRASGHAWIGTGANGHARLLLTTDYGEKWSAMQTPMIKGDLAGITSLDFINRQQGVIVGGDLAITDEHTANIFITQDGGQSWDATNHPIIAGAIYCVAYEVVKGHEVILICGPKGADISTDNGITWHNLVAEDLWRCELHPDGQGKLMGRGGKLYALQLE